MRKDPNRFTIDPNKIKVRDHRIKDMIATTGGTARVFANKKKAVKSDPVGRKQKYKKPVDIAD